MDRASPGPTLVERADRALRSGPLQTLELARTALKLQGNPRAVAAAVFALLGSDPRFQVDGAGVWRLTSRDHPCAPPLRRLTYAVVDVETTGGSFQRGHRVTEVAVVEVRNGEVGTSFQSLVNPGRPIPPGSRGSPESPMPWWPRPLPSRVWLHCWLAAWRVVSLWPTTLPLIGVFSTMSSSGRSEGVSLKAGSAPLVWDGGWFRDLGAMPWTLSPDTFRFPSMPVIGPMAMRWPRPACSCISWTEQRCGGPRIWPDWRGCFRVGVGLEQHPGGGVPPDFRSERGPRWVGEGLIFRDTCGDELPWGLVDGTSGGDPAPASIEP